MDPFLTNQIFPMESSLALKILGSSRKGTDFSQNPSTWVSEALSYLDEMQTDRLVPSEVWGCRVGSRDRGGALNPPGRLSTKKLWVINDLYKWDDPPSNHHSLAVSVPLIIPGSDLPVPYMYILLYYIHGYMEPLAPRQADISGNDRPRPLVPSIFWELEDEGVFSVQEPKTIEISMSERSWKDRNTQKLPS